VRYWDQKGRGSRGKRRKIDREVAAAIARPKEGDEGGGNRSKNRGVVIKGMIAY